MSKNISVTNSPPLGGPGLHANISNNFLQTFLALNFSNTYFNTILCWKILIFVFFGGKNFSDKNITIKNLVLKMWFAKFYI